MFSVAVHHRPIALVGDRRACFRLVVWRCVPYRSFGSSIIATAKRGNEIADPIRPTTSKACVETGLEVFRVGDAEAALELFQRALQLNPNDDEARAALYNSACALTKLNRWQEAADAVVAAVNERNLKLLVALRDPDLQDLRDRREWTVALDQVAGGVSNSGYIKLRTEAKAPFRLTRILFFGALAAGAGLGLLIITSRLVTALQGGENAPDVTDSAQNFGINAAALALLGYLLYRDITSQRRDQQIVEREEDLAALQVIMGGNRKVPLAAFRGSARPVILTGSRGQVTRALSAAEPYKKELRARGVSVIPVVLSDDDPGEALRRLKAELQETGVVSAVGSSGPRSVGKAQGFAVDPNNAIATTSQQSGDRKDARWQLEAADEDEWRGWMQQQARTAGVVSPGENFYVQVQLDGTVRASGVGNPPWRKFLDDLPELDDVRTKLTDGRGVA